MTTPSTPDFFGVVAEGVVTQTDVITLTATPSPLSKTAITSYPSQEAAGATPTADVIAVYDVTASKALALGTDYKLTASGAGETLTYSVTWVSTGGASSGDSCRVTYRYGTIPDPGYAAGDFQGQPAGTTSAPPGTAGFASVDPTTGSTVAGIGDQAAGGSLTDPAAGAQSSSETGAPGSEYAVTDTVPGTTGWPLGAPDTESAYGGQLPETFAPSTNYLSGTLDTIAGAGGNLVPAMFPSPNAYRAPSAGVAAGVKDTTLTDILGNQVNATPTLLNSAYPAIVADTSYSGAPAAPTALQSQVDAFAADLPGVPDYLSQQGVVASTIVVTNTTTSTLMVLGTDYTVTTAGNGPTTVAYVTPIVAAHFASGNSVSIAYSWGDATYWDSNAPSSVPGAPVMTSAVAVNRGATVTWQPPAGLAPVQYYMLQCQDLGTMWVPATGQPANYGQPSPSGGSVTGQPTYQADALTLLAAAIAAPAAPTVTGNTGSGSTLAGGVYKVIVTYVNANGESVGSASTSVTVTATDNMVITSPAASGTATGWYAYVTQVGGSTYTRQQAAGSPTAIATNLTLTAPPTSTGAAPPALNTTLATTSKSGVITPPGQVVVRDLTSSAQSVLASGEIAGGEADPLQADAQVLEYGYDYTIAQVGTGPWAQYQIALAAGSVNAAAGDSIVAEYWWGADPASISATFTQGLTPNTPVIYRPDGTTPYSQGYRFRVAAGNQLGLGPWSAYSGYVVPLNYNEAQPGHEGSITTGTGSLDPANTVNPIYTPAGTIKAGTGLGG